MSKFCMGSIREYATDTGKRTIILHEATLCSILYAEFHTLSTLNDLFIQLLAGVRSGST